MQDYRVVYITTETSEEAAKIGRALVEERLAACVNILPGMQSIYWWQGSIEEADEVVLIAKTHRDRMDQLTERVKALHSYDTPCVVAFPLAGNEGNADYLSWIGQETSSA